MKSILFFGECMLEENADDDLNFDGELSFCGASRYGGDTLNTALYLARTTDTEQLKISFATALSKGEQSEKLLNMWQLEGIDTKLVTQSHDKSIGRYRINTNIAGERSFIYDRSDSAAKYYLQNEHQFFSDELTKIKCDYFYFSGISLAILNVKDRQYLLELLTTYKNGGGKIIFDNNYREILWRGEQALPFYQQAMQLADIAFLTDEDEFSLYGDSSVDGILQRIHRWRIPEVIIKQGADPCLVYQYKTSDINEPYSVKTIESTTLLNHQVVDTCAAGDAFAAGYLAKRLNEKSTTESAHFAHLLASRVIQFSGAIITQDEMADLMPESKFQ